MEIFFFLVGYGLLLFLVLGIGDRKHRKKALRNSQRFISVDDITLVIPFRNEERNLQALLQAINGLEVKPSRILLINDHSEDRSISVINTFREGLNLEWLSLPKTLAGKKAALTYGISRAETPYVLTLDADVTFEPTYLTHIQTLPEADLWILPVVFSSASRWTLIPSLDVLIANAVNVGCFGWYRPVMASGANLLFKREGYLSVGIENHEHISSGDDMFLLRDFCHKGMEIRLLSDKNVAVYTAGESNVISFFNQRIRWLSKTKAVGDHFANGLGIFQLFISLVFLVLLTSKVLSGAFLDVFYLVAVKTAIDMYFLYPYFHRFKQLKWWVFFPFFQGLYPFYVIALIVGYWFYHPQWKGRPVKN
jgi:glycosyltransferase involved in cell wall biosynthesis